MQDDNAAKTLPGGGIGYSTYIGGGAMPIPGLPGYTALSCGIILNPRGVELRQWQDTPGGPWRVWAAGRNRMVSILVLSAFSGLPADGYFPRYRDGNKANSRIENLMWGGRRKWATSELGMHGA